MKYSKRLGFLNGFLNVVAVSMTIIFFMLGGSFFIQDKITLNDIITIIAFVLLFAGYFMVILNLKKILKSIKQKDPFNLDNVTYFKNIGYYIFGIGTIDAVGNYPVDTGFAILGTSNGSIKPISLLYLVLSILCFVLSDVFRMAMEIKDENDLTV